MVRIFLKEIYTISKVYSSQKEENTNIELAKDFYVTMLGLGVQKVYSEEIVQLQHKEMQ